jgi:uncharacterized SAM-binding protein YcdF (DUF218 family)
MFMLKKIVALFLCPVLLCLGISILGLIVLWADRRPRLGKVLVTLGTVLLLLLSMPGISRQLLTPLEGRYPALLHPEKISWEGQKSGTSPKWIVVLGGGHRSEPTLPANSQISAAALGRVVEGVRLYKTIPGSKLWFSGGIGFDPVPEAEVMVQIAELLGVKSQDISQESDSRDTADQAAIIAKKIGRERFILVTSAAHMPRSMALFKKRGLQPIPAPTDFLVRESARPDHGRFFPHASSLSGVEIAWHEYLGMVWAWLRGEI